MIIRFRRPSPPWLLSLLMAYGFLSACAQMSQPSYPPVPGVQEIDLKWQPKAGMRLAYQVTTKVDVSGALAPSVRENQRSLRTSTTLVIDIPDVGPDYFDFRATLAGFALPATMRFSKEWAPLEIRFDDPKMLGSADPAAVNTLLRQFGEPFKQVTQFLRRWRIGESHPFEIRLPGPPGTEAVVKVRATFRRVVVIQGRLAAEFDGEGSGDFTVQGSTGRVHMTSKDWFDVATGARLTSKEKVSVEFGMQGQSRMDQDTEQVLVLDFASSRF